MRIAVVGAGGVGGYFGARLAAAGNEVSFLARGAHLEAIRNDGLRVISANGDLHLRAVKASDDASIASGAEIVLVCVKLWDTVEVARALRGKVAPGALFVSLQNGVDAHRMLAEVLGAESIAGGVAHIAAVIVGPGVVRHTGEMARITVGSLAGGQKARLQEFVARAEAARIQAVLSSDMLRTIWEKFVMLAPFSGLTSLLRQPKGPMMGDPETRSLYAEAVAEACATARASGIALPPEHADRVVAFTDGLPAEMKSSMLADLEAGRRLELPWLSGRVAQLGDELGIKTPVNRFIATALKLHANGRNPG